MTLYRRCRPLVWVATPDEAGLAYDFFPFLKRPQEGVWVASYGDRLGYVWEYDDDHWSYQVNDRPAGFAKTQEAAKRACAGEIASL